jgi:hypothetical protein
MYVQLCNDNNWRLRRINYEQNKFDLGRGVKVPESGRFCGRYVYCLVLVGVFLS